jgi:hypothetical protein
MEYRPIGANSYVSERQVLINEIIGMWPIPFLTLKSQFPRSRLIRPYLILDPHLQR